MKLALNLLLSLAIAALCLYFAWPAKAQRAEIQQALAATRYGFTFLPFFGLMAVTFLFRAWRYNYLLKPLGHEVPLGRLLPISGVGFMAIFALPARLGELVRPYYVAEKGRLGMAEAVGAVAVERIADGLVISLLVFVVFVIRARTPGAPGWMMPVAGLSLGVFVAATLFLAVAHGRPALAVRAAVIGSVVGLFSPRAARFIDEKVRSLTAGFRAMHDARNLTIFFFQTITYWFVNGLASWWIGYAMGLPLSLVGAFAVMGLIGVAITLPNAPGNVGQFELAGAYALALYLPATAMQGAGMAYILLVHAGQAIFYVGIGLISLLSPHASLVRAIRESNRAGAALAAASPREGLALPPQ